MNTTSKARLLIFLVLFASCTSKAKTIDRARATVQELIPAAAGIKASDFDDLASGGQSPKIQRFKDQSLTLLLICQPVSIDELSDDESREFEHLNAAPNPRKMVDWILSTKLESEDRGALVTAVPAKGIKNCSCQIEGDLASGKFQYEIPEFCRGEVQFTARKDRGAWQITEFSMPAKGVKLTLQEGIWKKTP